MEPERPRAANADLLSVIAHDIRAPLGVILGAIGELGNRQVGELNDEQRALVHLVRRASEKLSRLANNVAVLHRMTTARIDLARQSLDMRLVVQRALDALERSSELGKMTLTWSPPDHAVTASVDAERATQVVSNLLANALRFARREIRVALREDDAAVHVTVEDDGPGLAPAAIPALFAAMPQSGQEGTTEPARPGTSRGLGLLVARGILDAHGGSGHAENVGGDVSPKGARFRVSFPRRDGV